MPADERLERTIGVRLRLDQVAALKAIRAERDGTGDISTIARELISEAIAARKIRKA